MSYWYAAAADRGPGLAPLKPASHVAEWESIAREAADKWAQRAIDNWAQFDSTGNWPDSAASGLTMYDGAASLFDLFHYFGKVDQLYLDGAVAMVETYQKAATEGFSSGSNPIPYKVNTVLFYPHGMVSIQSFNPSLVSWSIPEFFENLVNGSQYGESGSLFNLQRGNLSRECANTVRYYLDSQRVGNALPATGRLAELVNWMKDHCWEWIQSGPERGIDPITYGWKYNFNGTLGSDDPAIRNLASFMIVLTTRTMALAARELSPPDAALNQWEERTMEWMHDNGIDSTYPGAWWHRVHDCRDCSDPKVQAAGSNTSLACEQINPARSCWHLEVPQTLSTLPANERAVDVLNGINMTSVCDLFVRTGQRRWADAADFLWNGQFLRGNLRGFALWNGKQFNQTIGHGIEYLRARVDNNIFTTFKGGPVS